MATIWSPMAWELFQAPQGGFGDCRSFSRAWMDEPLAFQVPNRRCSDQHSLFHGILSDMLYSDSSSDESEMDSSDASDDEFCGNEDNEMCNRITCSADQECSSGHCCLRSSAGETQVNGCRSGHGHTFGQKTSDISNHRQGECTDLSGDSQPSTENPSIPMSEASKDFSVQFDLHGYTPSEISVRTKDDQYIHVQAKHEVTSDSGNEYSEFHQVLTIPEDVDASSIQSSMTTDGKLIIKAARKVESLEAKSGETLPITHE